MVPVSSARTTSGRCWVTSLGYAGAGRQLVVLDKLTYAGNLANLEPVRAARGTRSCAATSARLRRSVDPLPGTTWSCTSRPSRTSTGRSRARGDFVQTNVVGTSTCSTARCGTALRQFVHVSTDEVYGSIEHGSWTEDDPLAPNSPYSASKAAGDLLARSYTAPTACRVGITRCSNNYGPYQYPEKVIPLFVTNLLDGLEVPLYGDGLERARLAARRRPLPRRSHLVLERGRAGEIYNIGGGTELSNKELTALLLEATGAGWEKVRRVVRPARPRPALLGRLDQDPRRARLPPAGVFRGRARRGRRVVPHPPRLVGAAQEGAGVSREVSSRYSP